MSSWLLAALLVSASPPSAVVVLGGVGVSDSDAAALRTRLDDEVRRAGWAPKRHEAAEARCLTNPACAAALLARADARLWVQLEVVRIASRANLALQVVDERGENVDDTARVMAMEALRDGAALLPSSLSAGLAARARGLALPAAPVAPPAAPTTPPPTTTTTPPTTAPTTPVAAAPVAAPPVEFAQSAPLESPGEVTWPAIAGVGVAAAGALLVVGGAGLAIGQNAVRLDGGADGDARTATAVTIPLGIAAALGGLAAVAGGVALLVGGDALVEPGPTP